LYSPDGDADGGGRNGWDTGEPDHDHGRDIALGKVHPHPIAVSAGL
jgi:hypothetical protein